MDINKVLRELHAERNRLNSLIASLEAHLTTSPRRGAPKSIPGRRGRKSMSAAERLAVSKRMTQYWESRRARNRENQSRTEQSSAASLQ